MVPVLQAQRSESAVLAALVAQTVDRPRGRLAGFLSGRAKELVAAVRPHAAGKEMGALCAHHARCTGADTCAAWALFWWLEEEDRVGICGTLITTTGTGTLLQDEQERVMWQAALAAWLPPAQDQISS